MAKDSPAGPDRRGGGCPICGGPTAERWRPFCSRRCADLDLGRWLTGAYSVPTDEDVPAEPRDPEE